MKKDDLENLINSIKSDTTLSGIFWENVAYHSFYSDLDSMWLLIYPFWWFTDDLIINQEIVQFQIIDNIDWSTTMEMKSYIESLTNFLEWYINNLSWFETCRIVGNFDEVLLKNNKERWVMTKRFTFYY